MPSNCSWMHVVISKYSWNSLQRHPNTLGHRLPRLGANIISDTLLKVPLGRKTTAELAFSSHFPSAPITWEGTCYNSEFWAKKQQAFLLKGSRRSCFKFTNSPIMFSFMKLAFLQYAHAHSGAIFTNLRVIVFNAEGERWNIWTGSHSHLSL